MSSEESKIESYSEEKEVNFTQCTHEKARMVDGELRCPCGAAWGGSRIAELEKVLKRDVV